MSNGTSVLYRRSRGHAVSFLFLTMILHVILILLVVLRDVCISNAMTEMCTAPLSSLIARARAQHTTTSARAAGCVSNTLHGAPIISNFKDDESATGTGDHRNWTPHTMHHTITGRQ